MKTLNRWWKALLYFLITGSTSVFIAACYGMPYKEGSWVIKVRDRQGAPVKGIEVTLRQYYAGTGSEPNAVAVDTTDEGGRAVVDFVTPDVNERPFFDALLQDIDSTANGGEFADTTLLKGDDDSTDVVLRKVQ